MIDATTPYGMARLLFLLDTGSDCWNVISNRVALLYASEGRALMEKCNG